MPANRTQIKNLMTCLICAALLLGIAVGCQGGGGNINENPLTLSFQLPGGINYNSIIAVGLQIASTKATHVSISLSFSEGPGQSRAMTPLPGRVDPSSLQNLSLPVGETRITYWWHAVADLLQGKEHRNVFMHVVVTASDGSISEADAGPLVFDYRDMPGLAPPPYVKSGELPSTYCGAPYSFQLTAQGGQPPLLWSLWPPGTQLPYFLELSHNGHLAGTIPEKYGPTTISFVALATDSNSAVPRQSAGLFTIFVDCTTVLPCAPAPDISFSSVPNAKMGESYFYQATATAGDGELHWKILSGSIPTGFEFTASGLLSGIPQAGSEGAYNFVIEVCDSCSAGAQCDTVPISLMIEGPAAQCAEPPSITTTTLGNARETFEYNTPLQAANGEGALKWTVIEGALPDGLVLTESGIIHGAPEVGTAGQTGQEYNFTAQVCDSCPLGAQCASKAFKVTVDPEKAPCASQPQITNVSPLPEAAEGAAYSVQFEASDGEGALTWEITNPLGLPNGLTFSQQGLLSGTPATGTQNTYDLHISVNDSCDPPQSDSNSFELKVNAAPCAAAPSITSLSLPAGQEGVAYDFPFQAVDGEGDLVWTKIGGPDLPSGLVLEPNGQLHGIPNIGTAGTLNDIEIQVEDTCWSGAQKASNLYSLTIDPAPCANPPTITTVSLPLGVEGVEYNYQLAAVDGEGALTWTVLTDNDLLPADLIFGTDGTISGIPQAGTTGNYNIHFQVCDSCNPAQCDDIVLALEIKVPCAPAPQITTTSVPAAIVGTPYSFQFEGTGGEGTLRWNVELMLALPPGFIMSIDGLLTGNPVAGMIGDYNFNVILSDSCYTLPQTDMDGFALTIQN